MSSTLYSIGLSSTSHLLIFYLIRPTVRTDVTTLLSSVLYPALYMWLFDSLATSR